MKHLTFLWPWAVFNSDAYIYMVFFGSYIVLCCLETDNFSLMTRIFIQTSLFIFFSCSFTIILIKIVKHFQVIKTADLGRQSSVLKIHWSDLPYRHCNWRASEPAKITNRATANDFELLLIMLTDTWKMFSDLLN